MIHSVVKDPTPWKLPNAQRRRELDNPIGGYEGMSVALCRHIGLGDQVCFDICKDDGTTLQAGVDVRSATFDIRFHCEGGVVSHRKKKKRVPVFIQWPKNALQRKMPKSRHAAMQILSVFKRHHSCIEALAVTSRKRPQLSAA